MKIVTKPEILTVLRQFDPLLDVESGFVDYSKGLACIPPVSELVLEKGEVHIKCGYLKAGVHYVIKVASGFYGNSVLGLPSSNGLMMLFSTETGEAKCLLQDEGILTDHRTAIAGAIVAKYFAPAGSRMEAKTLWPLSASVIAIRRPRPLLLPVTRMFCCFMGLSRWLFDA